MKAKLPKITKPIVKQPSSFAARSSTPKKVIANNDASIRR